jgi:hypothetical protein
MRRWRYLLVVVAAAAVVGVGFALTNVGSGLVLLVYVLVVTGLLFAWLIGRLGRILPAAPRFQRLLARPDRAEVPVEQLESVRRMVILAGSSRSDLLRLRPLARDIVAARLSRSHGVDLEREPERARSLLGQSRAWELVESDAPTWVDRDAPGWSRRELEQLVEELENL